MAQILDFRVTCEPNAGNNLQMYCDYLKHTINYILNDNRW